MKRENITRVTLRQKTLGFFEEHNELGRKSER